MASRQTIGCVWLRIVSRHSLVYMTAHLACGHPVPGWAHLPVTARGVKVQQLKAQPQTLFLGEAGFLPPEL